MFDRVTRGTRAVGAIAVNTFREAVRNKIFAALLVFAGGVLAFSLVLGGMSLHNEVRVATDVGLYASTFFSMVITVYVAINLLHTEIENKTIYTILSKPVRRWHFMLGKYLGIVCLDIAIVFLLYGISAGLRGLQGGEITSTFGWAFILILFQLFIVSAIALLFASFSTPLLSGLYAGGLFLLGHLHDQLGLIETFFNTPLVHRIVAGIEFVVPDFHSLNIATELVHGITVPNSYLLHSAWYAFSYSAVILFLAMVIFSQRDLY